MNREQRALRAAVPYVALGVCLWIGAIIVNADIDIPMKFFCLGALAFFVAFGAWLMGYVE